MRCHRSGCTGRWPRRSARPVICTRRPGNPEYAGWYATFWEVAERCFADRQGGSWWHELGPDGQPGCTIWAGKSDLYHVLNALLSSLLPPGPVFAAGLDRRR